MRREFNYSDLEVAINDHQSFDINLGMAEFKDGPSDTVIRVSDTEYRRVPVFPDLFPMNLDGDRYNGHLVYEPDGIEFHVLKNGETIMSDYDEMASLDVTDMSEEYGDVLALYLVGLMRR